jgi:mercuric ion binding protein
MSRLIALTILAASFAGTAHADHQQYEMRVNGLICPFCVAASEEALEQIEGVYEVAADLSTGVISVCASGSTDLGDERMAEMFLSHGFTYVSQTVSIGCTIIGPLHADSGIGAPSGQDGAYLTASYDARDF